MVLDDGDLARLARIERQLEREDPELAEALYRWGPAPGRPRLWAARLTVAVGLVFAGVAVLVGSAGWVLLAVVTSATGWLLLRTAPGESVLPRRRREPGHPADP